MIGKQYILRASIRIQANRKYINPFPSKQRHREVWGFYLTIAGLYFAIGTETLV